MWIFDVITWLAKQLLAFQERLYSMKLITLSAEIVWSHVVFDENGKYIKYRTINIIN